MHGTTLIRLRRLIFSRLDESQRDGGVAMLTAILFMIIMAGVSTIVLGVVTTQAVPSYIAQKGTKTIYSAQAGIQAALAVVRSAGTLDVSGNLYGDTTKLPCALTGTSNAAVDGNGYSVAISYYPSDPTSQGATWLAANKITCNTGTYGTSSNGPTSTPKFALITSQGTATQVPIATTTANRSITAVYKFKVSNINIPGGLIDNNGATACMQAVTATAGSKIGFVAIASCGSTSTNAALQLWSYTTAWQIALSSTTVGGAAGLCITGNLTGAQTTTNATLQTCKAGSDPARWNQLWSWTGNYTWEGELQTISGPNGSAWLTPGVANGTSPIGLFLQVATTIPGTMAPTALVGAGGAFYNTHQLVNYLEFGRCADVTNENLSSSAMISYPCKQDPTGGTSYITWNQKWYYCEPSDATARCSGVDPTAQQVYVYHNDSTTEKWCLTTPLSTAGNIFPVFQACATSGAMKAQQTWSRVYNSGTYLTSYLMTDEYGRCLEANSADLFSSSPVISELTVNTCNGADYQKWNAPATFVDSTVGGYREISGG